MKAENLKLNQWQVGRPQRESLAVVLARWIERARERSALAQLDELTKRDLGLSESDVWAETRKAPWRA